MSFIARRALSTSVRRFAANTPGGAGGQALKQETKRNPELMVRATRFHRDDLEEKTEEWSVI
jgi:hypothetical protein